MLSESLLEGGHRNEGDNDECEAGEREIRGLSAAPACLEAQDEEGNVRGPDAERDSHEGVEAAAVERQASEPDGQPEGQGRNCEDDRARGQAVERLLRGGAL